MPTKTKPPSNKMAKLTERRDKTYAELQGAKRQRTAHRDANRGDEGGHTVFVNDRPEDWRDEARNPKPDSPSGKKLAELKRRLQAPNPHDEAFDAAVPFWSSL